ncbi:MAG: helix-turn-helix domain-containing protein [Pseudomonadota bacterium]
MKPHLTGSRIRERRVDRGLKQAALAKLCGISPSYLNLIEHNRRRIGGKLLLRIASELEVEPQALSEGADHALLDGLRGAAERAALVEDEAQRVEEFAGRFPGWAAMTAEQSARIEKLERTVAELNDRIVHDPALSGALHDVLSMVTSIRSTASILAQDDVEPDWQARFLRNIFEDSRRLSDAAGELVGWLEAEEGTAVSDRAPQDELEDWLTARDWHVAELERALAPSPEDLLADDPGFTSDVSRATAAAFLQRYRADAERIPLARLREAVDAVGPDPLALAERFDTSVPRAFRRLATLPLSWGAGLIGFAQCDASGAFTLRKSIPGYSIPRFGSAAPDLPIYEALARPLIPVRATVEAGERFVALAVSAPVRAAAFGEAPLVECFLLILPDPSQVE